MKWSLEFEERQAARFGLLSWSEYLKLTGLERSETVAHYRLHMKAQAVVEEEATD